MENCDGAAWRRRRWKKNRVDQRWEILERVNLRAEFVFLSIGFCLFLKIKYKVLFKRRRWCFKFYFLFFKYCVVLIWKIILSVKVSVLYIYIYIYMRWVQVTPDVKSYTFFKPLDLSRFNGKKKNSLMLIFWLESH